MRLDEGLARGWHPDAAERAKGLDILRGIGAAREVRDLEERA
jgi:hypothetical protein